MAGVLMNAVRNFHFKQMLYLLKSGLSINIKDNSGKNAMAYALEIEDAELRYKMVKFLILRGIGLSDRDRVQKRNALMWACCYGRLPEARLIMRKGRLEINLSDKDRDGKTVLHYAVQHGDADLVRDISKSMLHHGYSVDVPDEEGFTPYLIARKLGFNQCVDVLVKDGMASTSQFDHKAFKMARLWEEIGQKERSQHIKDIKNQRVAIFKTLGRLPQLKRAGYNVDDVRIVPSKKDRRFLGNAPMRASEPCSLSTSTISLPAIPQSRNSLVSSGLTMHEDTETNFPGLRFPKDNLLMQSEKEEKKTGADSFQFRRSLSSLFDMFGTQYSTVYRQGTHLSRLAEE